MKLWTNFSHDVDAICAGALPGSPLRELVEGNYRIVNRQRRGLVEILTVFEGHRRFPREDIGQS